MDTELAVVVAVVIAFFEMMKWIIGKIISSQEKIAVEKIRDEFWEMRDMLRDLHDEYKTKKIAKAVKNNADQSRL